MKNSNMAAIFLLLLLLLQVAAAQQGNISLGASLYSNNNSHWLSDSGQFAFGFYSQGNDIHLGIWFEKTNPKTIIWTATRDPLKQQSIPNDARLIVSVQGLELILKEKNAFPIPVSNSSQPVARASLLDSGNFVLYNSDSNVIWQTFDLPTDTIVAGQRLLAGKRLISSISNTNHGSGRFQVIMQRDGNLVQYPTVPFTLTPDQYSYWASGTFGAGVNVSLNLDQNGELYLLNSTGSKIKSFFVQKDLSMYLVYRLTIDADGILWLYSFDLVKNDSWSIEWSSTDNKCAPLGLCGLNSYCVLVNQEPSCVCLPGSVFIDGGQKYSGCKRNLSTFGCIGENETSYSIVDVDNIAWENAPYSVLSMNKTACKEDCLMDCNCEAATFRDQLCRKQKLPLRFGRTRAPGLVTTFVKKGITDQSSGTKRVSKGRTKVDTVIFVSSISTLTFSLVVMALTGVVIYRYRVLDDQKVSDSADEGLIGGVTLRSYTYRELQKATKCFTNQVGKGAFGTVFKGVIGGRVVAVKQLENVLDEEREFRNEMNAIGRTHHKNLVKLLGYCHDGTNRLLVYEFMTNGSLADFFFKSNGGRPTWEERIGIALNVAQGILYLHEECDTQIIHCDIKPENILMSEQKCAKLADFGLAKLLKADHQSGTNTGFRGTRGYVAPEWHRNLTISVKADVYSFGVVLLEIICCQRGMNMAIPDEVTLENWMYRCLEANELEKLVKDDEIDTSKLREMVKLGLCCIQEKPSFRPSMKKVVLMLEGILEIPSPPNPFSAETN